MNSAQSYLLNLVNQWKEFCKSHKNFEKALNDILTENNRLKAQNSYLSYRVNELESKLKGGVDND